MPAGARPRRPASAGRRTSAAAGRAARRSRRRGARRGPRAGRSAPRAALAWITSALSRICSAARSVAVGQGAGVHGDQGDPVGEHVVHLPGDPLPLGCGPGSTRSSCSASACSARSRRVQSSSRREPMYMPQADDRDRDDQLTVSVQPRARALGDRLGLGEDLAADEGERHRPRRSGQLRAGSPARPAPGRPGRRRSPRRAPAGVEDQRDRERPAAPEEDQRRTRRGRRRGRARTGRWSSHCASAIAHPGQRRR